VARAAFGAQPIRALGLAHADDDLGRRLDVFLETHPAAQRAAHMRKDLEIVFVPQHQPVVPVPNQEPDLDRVDGVQQPPFALGDRRLDAAVARNRNGRARTSAEAAQRETRAGRRQQRRDKSPLHCPRIVGGWRAEFYLASARTAEDAATVPSAA
jgi:hypothetical protein